MINFSESLGEILEWDFGKVMDVKTDPGKENYLFSEEAVPFHWDGAFYKEPSYLIFNCMNHCQTDNGRTLFTNTEKILESLTDEEYTAWKNIKLEYTTEKKAHYGGKFETYFITRDYRLRYAEPVQTKHNPISLKVSGCDDSESFIQAMQKKLYQDTFCYRHTWQPGDLLVANNHTLVHGREALQINSPRHIRRIQVL